ncbi:diacylglycerol kinase family lipid kinase [Clostridium swellfunianum]|uniref:diacylglycerol/lipid kinase family protein n=1 Tax=Clostridium swellfunianum TaxID=1367462 RepID=UPI00202FD9A5|nr:diacylglycerol kinase family protein [Clostridium swellfunianum]MCM0646958.1 diacylglycerol kinase family lipid kinase [Clostridium swellfunianum]
MKHLFIINPAAGKGKNLKLIPIIEEIFKNKEDKYFIEITKCAGHATEIAKSYSQKGDYRIYSVGGDGTLNEVLNGMVNSSSSLAVIPCGTGNDFIKSIYNFSKNYKIEDLLMKIINGKEKFIDLCTFNYRYFINIASVGFDAEVAYNAIKVKKFPCVGGMLAYIIGIIITVFKYNSYKLKINIDEKVLELDGLLAAIANGRYYGGGIFVAPKARIDDGLFSICAIEKVSRLKILALFPKVIKGTHEDIKEVSFYQGSKVRIESDKPVAFNIDGEITKGKIAEFKIIKNGIKIIYP